MIEIWNLRILKEDEWGLKGNYNKTPHTCHQCGKTYYLRSGEVEYLDGKYTFCSYNCRSKWRKMWNLRKRLISIDFGDDDNWSDNCHKFDKWIKELGNVAEGYIEYEVWIKLLNHTKKYAINDEHQIGFIKYVLKQWDKISDDLKEQMFYDIITLETYNQPTYDPQVWFEYEREKLEREQWKWR